MYTLSISWAKFLKIFRASFSIAFKVIALLRALGAFSKNDFPLDQNQQRRLHGLQSQVNEWKSSTNNNNARTRFVNQVSFFFGRNSFLTSLFIALQSLLLVNQFSSQIKCQYPLCFENWKPTNPFRLAFGLLLMGWRPLRLEGDWRGVGGGWKPP